jgi:hypothetical protein
LAENGHKFPNIQRIYLSNNKITDAGVKALAENGDKFKNLDLIELGGNKITNEGFKIFI